MNIVNKTLFEVQQLCSNYFINYFYRSTQALQNLPAKQKINN